MPKSVTVNGYCPTQDKDFSISVDYISTRNLHQTKFTKGLMTCEFASFGGECDIECPLYESTPEKY